MELSKVPSNLQETFNKVSKDGVISKQEYHTLLKAAAPQGKNSELSADEIQFLGKLKSGIENSVSKSGVATKNLGFLDSEDKKVSGSKAAGTIAKSGLGAMASALGSVLAKGITNTGSELFPNGVKSIKPSDVIQQSGIGDCYFLAGLASLAEKRPRDIMKMIKDNGNNTYTVTFPGVQNGTVTVNKPANIREALWSSIIEDAYLKVDKIAGSGGGVGVGIIALTGHSADVDFLSATRKSTTREKLKDATQNNRIVTASIASLKGGRDENTNIVSKHAYSVLSYDSATDTVKVRNPWGKHDFKNIKNPDKNDDGTFTLTLDEFDKIFTQVSYEQVSKDKLANINGYVFDLP